MRFLTALIIAPLAILLICVKWTRIPYLFDIVLLAKIVAIERKLGPCLLSGIPSLTLEVGKCNFHLVGLDGCKGGGWLVQSTSTVHHLIFLSCKNCRSLLDRWSLTLP